MKEKNWSRVYLFMFWLASLVIVAQLAIDETEERYEQPSFPEHGEYMAVDDSLSSDPNNLYTCDEALLHCASDVLSLEDELSECKSKFVFTLNDGG